MKCHRVWVFGNGGKGREGGGGGGGGGGRAMYLPPWSVSDQLLIPPLIGKAENNELLHGHEKMI